MNNFLSETRKTALKKPILVTGGNRTGTTWVGKMLAASKTIGYIREAFNTEIGLLKESGKLRYEYQYIQKNGNNDSYIRFLNQVLSFRYSFLRLVPFSSLAAEPFTEELKPRAMHFLSMLRYRFGNRRPLLKDPVALFSAEWLSDVFNMNVVILIRHPAAYVASIKRVGWRFDFKNLTSQKELIKDYLSEIEVELVSPPNDIIAEAALLWKCFYHVVKYYKLKRPEWIFLRHEDLCQDPVGEFRKVYEKIGIPFGPVQEQIILLHTANSNPTEAPGNVPHRLKRDSKSLVQNWRNKLTENEINRIRAIVGQTAEAFYTPMEW